EECSDAAHPGRYTRTNSVVIITTTGPMLSADSSRRISVRLQDRRSCMNHEIIQIMDRLEVQKALSKGVAEAWKISHLRDSRADIVSWLPIASLNSRGSPICLSADGYWVVSATDNTVVKLLEGKPLVFL